MIVMLTTVSELKRCAGMEAELRAFNRSLSDPTAAFGRDHLLKPIRPPVAA